MTDTQPSFTRGVFAGAVYDELLFPYPDSLDRNNPAEASVVHRLIGEIDRMELAGIIDPARFDEEETVTDEVIAEFARVGLLGLTIPRQYGGLELSHTAYARVFERISVIDPSLAVLVGVHCGLGSKAIVLYGSEEQKSRYLPMLARGETLAAYALTEPETGSDAQNIKTTARLSDDGAKWILDGHKIWIGNAHKAGVIATFAQTSVERRGERVMRSTAFIIRPDMPGFRILGTVRKLGIRGSTQAELLYEGLEVPADHVLGTVGKGFTVAVQVLNAGRLTLAAGCAAGAKEIAGEMARYAEQRVQFGHPLAHFEITQRKLSHLAASAYAADSMLGILASLADKPDADFSLEAACTKVFSSELIWEAADEMVQVAGGRGFVKPYPYERMLRDARINRIFEGANEVLRLFIALNGIQGPAESLKEVGTALRRPVRNLGLLTGFAASRVRSIIGTKATLEPDLHPRLHKNERFFEKHVAELSTATQRAITRHRKEIIERQLVLERLANMAIELFATACVISRTQTILDERGEEGAERELSLCDLFCVESGLRFRANREMLTGDTEAVDAKRRTVAADLREAGRYYVADAILVAENQRKSRPRSSAGAE
ncbi:MAG: acyl-CoA dehydrogenase family protein [Gemmatimonadaceae bacterium]